MPQVGAAAEGRGKGRPPDSHGVPRGGGGGPGGVSLGTGEGGRGRGGLPSFLPHDKAAPASRGAGQAEGSPTEGPSGELAPPLS